MRPLCSIEHRRGVSGRYTAQVKKSQTLGAGLLLPVYPGKPGVVR